VDFRTLDHHIAHPALIDLAQKLRERDFLRLRARTLSLKQLEQSKEQKNDDHPEGEIAQIGIHRASLLVQVPAKAAFYNI
jgi:hypothetical protein